MNDEKFFDSLGKVEIKVNDDVIISGRVLISCRTLDAWKYQVYAA